MKLSEIKSELKLKQNKNTVEESLLNSITNASAVEISNDEEIQKIAYFEPIISNIDFVKLEKEDEIIEENLTIGEPLEFSKSEE